MSSNKSIVRYADIPGFPGYEAGTDGSIWSLWKMIGRLPGGAVGRIIGTERRRLRPVSSIAYMHLHLRKPGGPRITRVVHRLILETFVGPRPEGMQARHIDGNSHNNALSNLVWGTKLENEADRKKHGKVPKGAGHNQSKLTDDEVIAIRALRAAGATFDKLAARYCVSRTLIRSITTRRNWKHI